MTLTTVLGLPRIGARRELKFALEAFWAGRSDAAALHETAAAMRADLRERAARAGLAELPVGDFALYDHVLDTALALGAIPRRFREFGRADPLTLAFAMARGAPIGGTTRPALEMTKWFDTNYHYLVPELSADMAFGPASAKHRELWAEAHATGHAARPVLLGPLTFLRLAKMEDGTTPPASLLDPLLDAYAAVLADLARAGVTAVQIDEPALVLDQPEDMAPLVERAFERLRQAAPDLRLWLATYFGPVAPGLQEVVAGLPVDVLHLDLVRGPDQLEGFLPLLSVRTSLSLGLVDGRNVWISDLDRAIGTAERVTAALGPERVAISSSCSLLHVPYEAAGEDSLDPELRGWLAFAQEKMAEVAVIGRALDRGRAAVAGELEANRAALEARRRSPRVVDSAVRDRTATVTPDMARRKSPYERRRELQRERFALPLLPTTTIGSFPQTKEIRAARAAHRRGELSDANYEAFLQEATTAAVRRQEELGLDVLVHGEFERNDMVEYFGEQLSGVAFTRGGWVQSYGSRCVKPPVIYGDVQRQHPMTVRWSRFAQSLTDRPMKGMLTGPVTILQWSFVRDDQPRSITCRQIALAIRDEVRDLEQAGIGIIQIDEPALREGLPLRRADWEDYLAWAGECFRIAASGVEDATQIHTHMCYAEFNDIIEAIAGLDADVISIETTRSRMELLKAFANFSYPNEIGPGVWDIHSPRVPGTEEMAELIGLAAQRVPAERLWVNPDCGLKTRGWEETTAALSNLVAAARIARARLAP
jgi:5-methyltetrahydropteroyltriglutamate--homocysteine methyltransferase